MKMKIFSLVAALALTLAMSSMAKADSATFDFVYQNGGISPTASTYGTVTVQTVAANTGGCTSNTSCIEFTLTAATGYAFHMGVGGDTFAFGMTPDTTITLVGAPAGWSLDSGANMDGFGSGSSAFDWGLDTGSGSGTATSITFYITTSGGFSSISVLDDLNNGGVGDTFFAAFMTPNPTNGCTGYVGTNGGTAEWTGTSGTNTTTRTANDNCGGSSTVPEPGSLMLFGTGLLGMAGFVRRKLMS